MEHLLMNLQGPFMSFGTGTIDGYGFTGDFPGASMLTGLLANALGWDRTEKQRLQELQSRLVFAARMDREPKMGRITVDLQSVALTRHDSAWTTRGTVEQREGGEYENELRYREYLADARISVALRLMPVWKEPTLAQLAQALDEPARPLFIGRKSCIPSTPIFAGMADGETALSALLTHPLNDEDQAGPVRAMWPKQEETLGTEAHSDINMNDQRNWVSGLHGGTRPVCEARLSRSMFAKPPNQEEAEWEAQQEAQR